MSKSPIYEVSESDSIVFFFSPAGLLIVVCFWQRWVFGDFWVWVQILWNILVGILWGPTWNSIPPWGLVFPFPSALWSLSTWVQIKEQSLAVVLLDYNPGWKLTWGPACGYRFTGKIFSFPLSRTNVVSGKFCYCSFCRDSCFLIHPNTEGIDFGIPDLCGNLLLDYVQVKMETWGPWVS